MLKQSRRRPVRANTGLVEVLLSGWSRYSLGRPRGSANKSFDLHGCARLAAMPEWIGWATKTFSYIGQVALKHWLFQAELLGAARTVYTSEHGDSPYVNIGASVRVHNRNHAPTTVYVRSIAVRLASGVEIGLERAVMVRPGPISPIEDIAGFNSYEVPGCSTVELTLSTRKYNPPDLDEYLEDSSPQIVVELVKHLGIIASSSHR